MENKLKPKVGEIWETDINLVMVLDDEPTEGGLFCSVMDEKYDDGFVGFTLVIPDGMFIRRIEEAE